MAAPNATERWTYLGRVELKTGKVGHRWRDEGGVELAFAVLRGMTIGGLYELEVTRGDDGAFESVKAAPLYIGRADLDADAVARLRAEDQATMTHVEARRAHARDARENVDIGDMTLRQVRAMWMDAVAGREHAVMARVIGYITRRGL
jgi:hypothetical protein